MTGNPQKPAAPAAATATAPPAAAAAPAAAPGDKTRILFVDDEPQILDGLQGLLRRQRKQWDMVFAVGGEAAMKALAAAPFDIIVTDMRMPGIDVAHLLRHVQATYPKMARIVLSGQTDQDVARRIVHVAHQFLSKPCEGQQLQAILERTANLQRFLQQAKLRETVGQLGHIPVTPRIYSQIVSVLSEPTASLADVAAVLERDAATSAKILQVVNSAFFGLPQRLSSVANAVMYLGAEMVKSLVLSIEISQQGPSGGAAGSPPAGIDLQGVQQHGLLTARVAKKLTTEKAQADAAFTAGIMQDAGLTVLAVRLPQLLGKCVEVAREKGSPLESAERELLGVTHAEIGAYLLGLWGLPYPIVDAVMYHHAPGVTGGTTFDVTGLVHVASALVGEALAPRAGNAPATAPVLDVAHVERLGLTKRLADWRAIARAEAQAAEKAA